MEPTLKKLKSGNPAQATGNLTNDSSVAKKILEIEQNQCRDLLKITYGTDITYIYNPIDHALELHLDFLQKYCLGNQPVLLLGMNPGPWGMSQTGVPFGEIDHVKNYLNVNGCVTKPVKEHPKRPILGLECKKREVSGERMWSFLKSLNEDPKKLFKNIFIHNYCPLAYMKESAKNVTPADMKVKERCQLEAICDKALIDVINLLKVKYIVGIGAYTVKQTNKALKNYEISNVKVSTLMHPSPINPAANKGWHAIARKQLEESSLLSFFTSD